MLPIMENSSTNSSTRQSDKKNQAPLIPAVALPKGGGAIRGIGEKFNINALTGTSSFSIPISMTPGRGGFTPQLSLEYNSGNGNSAWGYGWNIGLATVSRKTAKGIPKYDDTDVFIFSGGFICMAFRL